MGPLAASIISLALTEPAFFSVITFSLAAGINMSHSFLNKRAPSFINLALV